MQATLSERLTAQFYAWERRGRGWDVYEQSIQLEPPFYPFFGHKVSAPTVIDDGRKQSFLGRVLEILNPPQEAQEESIDLGIPAIQPFINISTEHKIALGIALPKDEKIVIEQIDHLLLMLSITNHPVSFEIIAKDTNISIQLVCSQSDAPLVEQQVAAYFPNAVCTQKGIEGLDIIVPDKETCRIDFGLADEFMRPLTMTDSFASDSFIGLFGMLEQLQTGERGIIQVLFCGTGNPWAESIMRSVSDDKGGSFFADAPEMVKLASEKVSYPLYAVSSIEPVTARYSPTRPLAAYCEIRPLKASVGPITPKASEITRNES